MRVCVIEMQAGISDRHKVLARGNLGKAQDSGMYAKVDGTGPWWLAAMVKEGSEDEYIRELDHLEKIIQDAKAVKLRYMQDFIQKHGVKSSDCPK